MMTIVSIMIPTSGFQALAYTIADLSLGRLFLLLVMMGTLVTVLSLLLDKVTTVVIFGPLIILICQALRVSPIPFLLAAALLSDPGGVATLVGDPPNLMIGSAAGIDFNTFFAHIGFIVLCAWVGTVFFLKFLFRKELAVKPVAPAFRDREAIKDPATWKTALGVLGAMVVGFILHDDLGWEAWFVSALGLTAPDLPGSQHRPGREFCRSGNHPAGVFHGAVHSHRRCRTQPVPDVHRPVHHSFCPG